ncbi:transcriptional regulator, Fis family [Leptospira interrogans serovar Icterohaemorrhagiae str. Verdun HP]|uniref:Transcriptional regulator, Fis family n=1 Tax=Leptospira interrogans serovar Icterohaemorrhagiae str. Verdun HP TaxID=1049910 RepID=M6RQ46_LEPIR|nr:transcriptional regulator, Fis family [Leptospira interrogans serovar Icterohaemorrhagiae str. Verdun HP]
MGKWLHRSLSPEKGILVIGFLPEQISKLEKSLDEWIRMTDSGSILIEGTEKFSSIHQKFFFKLLSEGTVDSRLIFTETQGVESFEIFKPFREFLLQRTIFIPSLDSFHSPQINSLVQLILEELKESMGREDLRLSEKNLQKILTMNFDKNLSSLRNLLEESILSSSGSEIEILDRKEIRDRVLTIPDSEDLDLRTAVEAVERQKILLAQKLFGGNQIRMARALGISRGSLQYKLKQLEIG